MSSDANITLLVILCALALTGLYNAWQYIW
jgi:hypothetical protein